MRILQVNATFTPYGGGTVTLAYQLSKTLMQRGHEVTVYASDRKLDQEYIDSLLGVKVHTFHSWLNLARLYLTPDMIGEVKRKLKSFDIIHLHGFRSFQNIVIHHYARKYGVPYVLQAHGSIPRAFSKKQLKWLFDTVLGYRILRDASKVIADTEVGVNEAKKAGISKDKIVLLPLAQDIGEFAHLPPPGLFRRKYDIKEKHIIIFLGRIHWIKGIDFLVESFYDLTRLSNDVILAIVGPDDGYRGTLKRLIDKLNLSEKVLFTGFLGGEEKLSALIDADIAVQPSRYEQAAWASIEAVLCGTPIIVSKNTGAGEDVKRLDAGYLVEFGNKQELVEMIQKILDDPSEARTKTDKAREYIKANQTLSKMIGDYESLYMECIRENKQLRSKK